MASGTTVTTAAATTTAATTTGAADRATAVLLNDADAPVVLTELATVTGARIGIATLNVEKTLNSLSLPMIDILAPALTRWATDDGIAMVWLQGAGERAFAAGGDIQALYAAMARNHAAGSAVDDYPPRFFESEYRLDHQLHCFPKPVLAWGHGVVMGGGLGLFLAASHRVVTERTRLAMPEVTIGLFPDAGATWLLRHIEPALARWLALTGSQMNAADACAIGLGQYHVPNAARATVLSALQALSWTGDADSNRALLHDVLVAHVTAVDNATSQLLAHQPALRRALTEPLADGDAAMAALATLATLLPDDDYITRGVTAARRGCPTSVGIIVEQSRRAPTLDLISCLRMELTVAWHCAAQRDFAEGVRALIVDKDNAPRWWTGDSAAARTAHVASHFVDPWPAHPLADLATGA